MSKALWLAAILALAPLPVLAQQGQTGGRAQSGQAQTAQGGQSLGVKDEDSYGEQGAFEEENSGSKRGDLLDRLANSSLRERIASGVERIEDACGPDIERYCGDISPGEGRMAACVRAYSDRLSRRCRFTLWRISRNIRQQVQSIADECLTGIQQQCGNASNLAECAMQKSASLSPTCQNVVQVIHEVGQKLAQLKDMRVYGSDGTDLGRVVDVQQTPDGKLKSVHIQIGRLLGLGDKVVTIDADNLQQFANGIRLKMNSGEVKNLPEAKQPDQGQQRQF